MRKIKFNSNEDALSIVQDTLLFLVFISISALILTPNIIQSSIIQDRYDNLYEITVQETLLTLLNSNNQKFCYKTGSSSIDEIANKIGINIKENQSVYQKISSQFFEKEQYHKSIRQLISENLFTQYKYDYQNKTLQLNPFSGDSEEQLTQLIQRNLDQILPVYINYNFTAQWYPFQGISFGGDISLGKVIPNHCSTFSSHQKISLPVLPCITFGNSTFCYHSSYFKNKLDYLIENVDCVHNLSKLFNNEEKNQSVVRNHEKLTKNLSELIQILFIDGIRTDKDESLIPSAYDILCSYLFSESYSQISLKMTDKEKIDSYQYIDSFFSFHSNDVEIMNTDISSVIINEFEKELQENIFQNFHSKTRDLSLYIKEQIKFFIRPMIRSITDLITEKLISDTSFKSNLETIIDTCFNHLSLNSASVSLTIWREI